MVSHTMCRLGKWYYRTDATTFPVGFAEAYRELESPHAQLHASASTMLRQVRGGQTKEALKTFEDCVTHSKAVVATLDRMAGSISAKAA
jgi:hypothetical protein